MLFFNSRYNDLNGENITKTCFVKTASYFFVKNRTNICLLGNTDKKEIAVDFVKMLIFKFLIISDFQLRKLSQILCRNVKRALNTALIKLKLEYL